jgi:hypothetical protein
MDLYMFSLIIEFNKGFKAVLKGILWNKATALGRVMHALILWIYGE